MDHSTWKAAINQSCVVIIGAVGEYFAGHFAAQLCRGRLLSGASKYHDDDIWCHGKGCTVAGERHRLIFGSHVCHRAVEFEMSHICALSLRHRKGRAKLVLHEIAEARAAKLHALPPEALQVVKSRMRADANTAQVGGRHGFGHHIRITRMKATSDIGRTDDIKQGQIVPHDPRPKALAHIGVQIDGGTHDMSLSRSSPAVAPLIN